MDYPDSCPVGTTTHRPVRHQGAPLGYHHRPFDGRLSDQQATRLSTLDEELANALTHGFGLVLSLIGAAVLMVTAVQQGESWLVVGCAIYAATLVGVYAASTLSHVFQQPELRRLFRILDQSAIYLLIAGTYTPFALAYLCQNGWWTLLAIMWTAALVGFFSKILRAHRVEAVSVPVYLVLGLLPLAATEPIIQTVPLGAIVWILASIFCFILGLIFFKLDEKMPYFHAAWHVMVIAGSACQFIMILHYVASPYGG